MRILLPLLAAVVFALPAHAQTATTKPTHTRLTMQQRFEQANVTHDGHLTLDQAKTGYKSVARHFDCDRPGQEGLRHRGRHPRLQQDAARAAPPGSDEPTRAEQLSGPGYRRLIVASMAARRGRGHQSFASSASMACASRFPCGSSPEPNVPTTRPLRPISTLLKFQFGSQPLCSRTQA